MAVVRVTSARKSLQFVFGLWFDDDGDGDGDDDVAMMTLMRVLMMMTMMMMMMMSLYVRVVIMRVDGRKLNPGSPSVQKRAVPINDHGFKSMLICV